MVDRMEMLDAVGRRYAIVATGRRWVPTRSRAIYECLTGEQIGMFTVVRVGWKRARFGYWITAERLLYDPPNTDALTETAS